MPRQDDNVELGPYAASIVSAYAAAVAIVAGLILWVVLDGRRLQRMLEQAEHKGWTRRSAREDEGERCERTGKNF
ncbi:MAG: heme exporter protein CcmD [Xanthobacteraceae bacterium]